MGLSNKVMLGLGAGAAALAFVGVGASASFTDTATGAASMTTGTVGVKLTENCGAYFTDGGNSLVNHWGRQTGPDLVAGSANNPNEGGSSTANSFTMDPITNAGSEFIGVMPTTIKNDGSLTLNSYSLNVNDPGVAHNATNKQISKDTYVAIFQVDRSLISSLCPLEKDLENAPIPEGVLPEVTPQSVFAPQLTPQTKMGADIVAPGGGGFEGLDYLGSLRQLEEGTPVSLSDVFGPLKPGQSESFVVVFASNVLGSGYTNADEGGAISPTFTVTGSDV